MKRFGGWLLMLLLAGVPALRAQTAPVQTQSGRVDGVGRDGGIVSYEGIPFAAPPVGRLRWQPPQPPIAWKGTLHADHFAPPCMQHVAAHLVGPWSPDFQTETEPNENCLYLNVWAPAHHSATPRPVLVWIYGGGFTSGSTDLGIYNGANLARQGLVVVSVAYRVGPFGFLAYPGLTQESPHHSSGNYGLLDQIAGLRWVRNNIAAFGGDPHHVTIFGQSAGGFSVDMLLQSPLARGLFQGAIIMSGPPALGGGRIGSTPGLSAAEKSGEAWARALGADSLAALRALPAQKVLDGRGPGRFAPISDGWVLPAGPRPLDPVPVMNGMVANDIGIGDFYFGPPPDNSPGAWRQMLEHEFGASASKVLALYPASTPEQVARERTALRRDRARVALSLWAARQEKQTPKVFLYYFDRKLPWPQHPNFGAFHSADIPYVFNDIGFLDHPFRPVDWRLARQESSYWANFAKHGSPDGTGLPQWRPYSSSAPGIMELGRRVGQMPLTADAARLQFWRGWLQKTNSF